MVLDLPSLTRTPPANLSAGLELRDQFALSASRKEQSRAPEALNSDLPEEPADWAYQASKDAAGSTRRIDWQTQRGGVPGAYGDPRSWDQSRPMHNPRGAPTDATPALTKLEARIAMEPNYVHHYASTRYANVSYLPWTLSERRQRIDIMA
jgi:hypothetical protein